MCFEIHWKEKGAIIQFHQKVKPGELLEANCQLYKNEEYDSCDWTMWDLSEVEHFRITEREAKYSAATDNATASLSRLSKVVLVARQKEIIETFQEYASIMRHMGNTWEFKIFPDQSSAVKWLTVN